MKAPQNLKRMQNWIAAKQPGSKFSSFQASKELNLTTVEVGSFLKWQPSVRKAGTIPHNITVWERIEA